MVRYLEPAEVQAIHERYVRKDQTYLGKYPTIESLEAAGITKHGYSLKGSDAPRAFTIADFQDWVAKYGIWPSKVLAFCAGDYELPFLPYGSLDVAVYDGTPKYDLHCLDLPVKDYDFALLSHTLEHLNSPEICIRRIFEHLAPGGYVFASLPTVSIPHCVPNHFLGYQPDGLACLFVRCGFDLVDIGYWGNVDYAVKMFTAHCTKQGHTWPDVYALSDIRNDPELPCQSWVLARRPQA